MVKKIIKWICIVAFIVSAGMIIKILIIDPRLTEMSYNDAKEIFHNDDIPNEDRLKSLSQINQDIKGWVFISGTRIDYPVLQSENDRMYYLTHNYKKEYSQYGSIFIDTSCNMGINSKNIILHGHHMRNGQMFADLMKFSDLEFYRQNPIIEFNTLKEEADWKIFSVFKTNTLPEQGEIFNYIISDFKNDAAFMEYVENVKKRSLLDIPIDINASDQLLTLSTCSYEFKDFRTVIVARKVRKGEERLAGVEKASKAKNPLMPRCWYEKNR